MPVICVGNMTVGGAGKTPVCMALAQKFIALGIRPAFLSRGYGGRLAGPLMVEPSHHSPEQVGDEPLLLSQIAPSWIARRRMDGAQAITVDGQADIILMDDGMQNPTLHKDFTLLVIDGKTGFGNGQLLPAGPMRTKLSKAIPETSAIVIIGEDATGVGNLFPPNMPVFHASIVANSRPDLTQPFVAFAGIGRPEKFFQTLLDLGCQLKKTVAFPDHRPYNLSDINNLKQMARKNAARLITTEKDVIRIPKAEQDGIDILPITLHWPASQFAQLMQQICAKCGINYSD